MQFGTDLVQIPAAPNPVAGILDRAVLLDELGYDFATIAHHRLAEDTPSACFPILGAVAARTSRLRFGPGVVVLPAYHPLDIAEQVATVDQLSDGRVFLGAGIGYRPPEFESVEVPYARRASRMTECLLVIKQVWAQDHVSFEGEHFRFTDVSLYPKPVQRPGPPIWIGALSAPAIRRAAVHGDVLLIGLMESLGQLDPLLAVYRETAAEAGRNPALSLKRTFAIASSRQELEEVWLPSYLRMRAYTISMGATYERTAIDDKIVEGRPVTLEEAARDRAIVGTPDEVVEEVRRCAALTGCESIFLNLDGFGGDPDRIEAQLRLFAAEVMPEFAT